MTTDTIKFSGGNRAEVLALINIDGEYQHAYVYSNAGDVIEIVGPGCPQVSVYRGDTITRTETEFVIVSHADVEPRRFPRIDGAFFLKSQHAVASANEENAAEWATLWTSWADQLQQLIDSRPGMQARLPYLNAEADESFHDPMVGHIDLDALDRALVEIRSRADAMVGAYQRAARVIEKKQAAALQELANAVGQDEAATR
ncbi:hypothetical protein [Saccharothrix xinjiangensis]|uniref:Uncharacterized protein n=1 Tax=Saccharothrix xinjiangensis TaxID=204798 RepID=A0ABV9XWU9_9PSEU